MFMFVRFLARSGCRDLAKSSTGGNLSFTDPLETTALLKDNSSDKLGGKRENKAEGKVFT